MSSGRQLDANRRNALYSTVTHTKEQLAGELLNLHGSRL